LLESLLDLPQQTDFLSRAYDNFVGEVGWRNWFDIAGGLCVLVSGVRRTYKPLLLGIGIAVVPELSDHALLGGRYVERSDLFFQDVGVDILGAALVYGAGYLLHSWIQSKRRPNHSSHIPPSHS
jgi:hypothetical protein